MSQGVCQEKISGKCQLFDMLPIFSISLVLELAVVVLLPVKLKM
jgi:hypothetical protein